VPLTADDRLQIHELLALHGHLADDRRPEDLDQLLTEDAVYDVSAYGLGVVAGLPALRRLFADRPGDQPAGHHVTNVLVTEHPDGRVTTRSKGLSVMPDGRAGSVVYADTVARTPAGWRIAHRVVYPSSAAGTARSSSA
jgi:hypothetical protein